MDRGVYFGKSEVLIRTQQVIIKLSKHWLRGATPSRSQRLAGMPSLILGTEAGICLFWSYKSQCASGSEQSGEEKQSGISLYVNNTSGVDEHHCAQVYSIKQPPLHQPPPIPFPWNGTGLVHEVGGGGGGSLKINPRRLVRHFEILFLSQSDREVKDTASW